MNLSKASWPIVLGDRADGVDRLRARSDWRALEIGVKDRANAYASIGASGQIRRARVGREYTKAGALTSTSRSSHDGGRTFGAPTRVNRRGGRCEPLRRTAAAHCAGAARRTRCRRSWWSGRRRHPQAHDFCRRVPTMAGNRSRRRCPRPRQRSAGQPWLGIDRRPPATAVSSRSGWIIASWRPVRRDRASMNHAEHQHWRPGRSPPTVWLERSSPD